MQIGENQEFALSERYRVHFCKPDDWESCNDAER